MIYIEANPELKNIFQRLIKTMKVNVDWNDVFVVSNNLLILTGKVRSLFFNFDNGKVFTNIIEIPVEGNTLEDVSDNVIVANALNMVLYAFGKWGSIPGLKVEKDYAQLNALFRAILKEVKIEPGYRDDNFRFYKNGVEITYEDTIQTAIEEGRKKKEEEAEEAEEEEKLGLWHNMRWITQPRYFAKEEVGNQDRTKNRIGNNFYLTGYHCPDCGELLYMVVYPVDQEFLIETDEARVYLARAYTCNSCSSFFTPRPGKLLREGDVYVLRFAQDRNAYEDYLELIGRKGERTCNYKFNEYETDHNRKKQPKPLSEECDDMEHMTEEELLDMEEKMEAGFYPKQEIEPYYQSLKELIPKKTRKHQEREKARKEKECTQKTPEGKEHKAFWRKMEREREHVKGKAEKNETRAEDTLRAAPLTEKRNPVSKKGMDGESVSGEKKTAGSAAAALERIQTVVAENPPPQIVSDPEAKARYDARMTVVDRMSPRQLRELESQIEKDKRISDEDRDTYRQKVKDCMYRYQARELQQKAENCRDKTYGVISRVMEEVENSECPRHMKEPILEMLRESRRVRAQKEAEDLMAHIPPAALMDRKRYQQLRDKLNQFPEADLAPFEDKLEECRDVAERQEIASLVKHTNTRDRHALRQLKERLEKQDFSQENISPVLEQIKEKIKALDMDAIDELCPDLLHMTFEEGLQAYEDIEKGIFLPELKANTLEMIDKRLTKIKMDECELLVRKLRQELEEKISFNPRIHFYDIREIQRGTWDKTEEAVVNCALETFASDRGKYEFPIVICDASRKETGKEGFVLTPDHLYYNSAFSSESITVNGIRGFQCSTGLLNRGVYVDKAGGDRSRLPVGIQAKEWKEFTSVMRDFIEYLQEKPESRKVSYLVKEKHEVKCCYRCGYTYRGGNVCPKCGNKMNK